MPFIKIISSVMLAASGEHHRSTINIALETSHIVNGVGGHHKRILAGSLLASAPTRITEDVDIGSPEGEPSLAEVVHGACLNGDGSGDGAPESAVEGGGGEKDLGEAGGGTDAAVEEDAGAVDGDSVEGFRPPLVWWYAETGNGGGGVGELLDLLGEGEEGDQGSSASGDGK